MGALSERRASPHNVCFSCGRSNEMRTGGHARPPSNYGVAARPLPTHGHLLQASLCGTSATLTRGDAAQ